VVFLEIQDFSDVMPCRLVESILVPLFLSINSGPIFMNLPGQLYAEDEDATGRRNSFDVLTDPAHGGATVLRNFGKYLLKLKLRALKSFDTWVITYRN
jgi:hypothetical protein